MMHNDYLSPFDAAAKVTDPLAFRPASVFGRHVVLLDIRKNRSDELLDRIEERLGEAGATTSRVRKEIFSRPASPEVIEEVVRRADLVVEALAD